MKPHLFSTSILITLLLPLTLAIRSDAEQNRGDLPPITTTRLAQSDPLNDSPTPQQVQTAAQQITVRVTSAQNGGSGVLVAQKGSTYLVLTNRHVTGRDTQFQIQTRDGQKHAARLVPNTGINPKYDLALLQFTSSKQYQLAKFKYSQEEGGGSVTPLDPTRAIYSAGFPFDSERLRFSNGKVSQLSDVPLEDGTQIGYTIDRGEKELRQGMSGGPIIDAGGLVIGINTVGSNPLLPSYTYFDGSKPTAQRAVQYQQANWGIPIYNFLTQLDANILYNYDNFPKVQRQVTPTGYMAKLNRETRQQTVRIETANAGNGSGVIVAKQGDTYYVLTAKHVLETPATDKEPKQLHTGIKVITHEQEIYDIEPSNIRLAEGLDLAVVKFTSKVDYPVAKLGNYSPNDRATIFAAGYPGRDKIDSPLWQWQLNPGKVADKKWGEFLAQDIQSFSNGYDLIYTTISYGGMSGGAIFDTDGRVIGIHGRAEQINNALLGNSLGISIKTFIGVSDRLQVPNQFKISTNPSVNLNRADLATVIAVRDNIAKPQDDSNGEQWLQYGNQLYRIDKYSDAVLAFEQAINRGQQYKLAGTYGKASALFGNKDYYQALAAISGAISFIGASEKKEYYYLWKYQSVVFRELGKYDSALKSINVAIKLEPSDLRLLNEKAVLFGMRKQSLEAIAIYDLISSKQPEAYAYYGRGHFKYLLGQREAAIADFDRAISLNPSYTEAYSHRGVAKYDLEKYKEAIADYNRAISINSNYAEAYVNRGNLKVALGQIKEAVTDYDRAVSLNPNFTYAYYNRAFLKYRLNQNKEAIADYDRAISLISNTINPNTINPNLASAYNNRAAPKSDLGQKKEAIADYNKALSINPRLVTAYIGRSNNKFELGNNLAALIDIERAIIISPNNAIAFNNRAFLKVIMGKEREAVPDLERSISLDANQSESYACRGFIKEMFGNKQGAMVDYKQALKINPKLIEDWKKQASFLKKYNQESYQKYQQLIEKLEAATKHTS
ncbi:trypsin-like peptidase domain-containing protein [Chamaesiphon sp.]|uniref:trypsin-like peptidase domain-containing protein n=1 Tax=Chamaesiphon sp. TaxID=2814140 RepID=UPI003593D3AB